MIVLKTPEINFPGTAIACRWIAAYNPLVFVFKREDEAATAAPLSTMFTTLIVKLNRVLSAAEIASALADPVRVQGAAYNFSDTALSHSFDSITGNSVLDFRSQFYISGVDESVTVFILASKPGYYVRIEITDGNYENLIYAKFQADINGVVRADLSAYTSALVDTNKPFSRIRVRYSEWDDIEILSPDTDAGYYYVTYSAMQLGDTYGGNLLKYSAFQAGYLAEWLTTFKEPVYNVGLPFDLSFIRTELLSGVALSYRVSFSDVNKSVLSFTEISISDNSPGVLAVPVTAIPPESAYYAKIEVFSADGLVMKPIYVRVVKPCDTDPYVYLKWINTLGGWEYYRFGYNQTRTTTVSNTSVINRNVFDWSTDNTIFDVVKKTANRKLQFGALNITDVSGIESLPIAIKTMMLMANGKYQTVELIAGSFVLGETRYNSFSVEFSINLPEINIQRQ